jgi:hypothetical protein
VNPPLRKMLFIVVACAAAATLGVGALVGIIGPAPEIKIEPTAQAVVTRPLPSATPTPNPPPTATPTPVAPVTLALTSLDRQPSLGGITATIIIENHRSSPLSFSFDPAYDVTAVDALGHTWPLRWAEYDGSPHIAAGSSARLVRAFFAGPVASATSWPLTITVARAPGIRKIDWHVPDNGTPTSTVDNQAAAIPTVAPSGPIALTLANPQPSSGLGGIQVDLMIQNDRSTNLVFRFDPNAQLSAEDNLNRPYRVRWAQYDGVVRVAPHTTTRLARVFFEGPVADARASWLTVVVRQVPGAFSLKNVVPLY